jgi:hypothetical protein
MRSHLSAFDICWTNAQRLARPPSAIRRLAGIARTVARKPTAVRCRVDGSIANGADLAHALGILEHDA